MKYEDEYKEYPPFDGHQSAGGGTEWTTASTGASQKGIMNGSAQEMVDG